MITHRSAAIGAVLLTLVGCATTGPDPLDTDAIWQRAEREHASAIAAVAERERLQADYAAVIRLSSDGERRGLAYLRLAELDLALGDYQQARSHLEQSLRAGIGPAERPGALLMLGDLFERHLRRREEALTAYRQVIAEHPGTNEAELAGLRMKELIDEH